jgi:hypothetical protein
MKLPMALIALAFAPAAAFADTFTVTFDGGVNTGGWAFGGPGETIAMTGGNPGAYLHTPELDTFAPQPRTHFGLASPFSGDYRGKNVSAIGVDLITISAEFGADGRPLTVMLISDNGTPGDTDDDWAAYFVGAVNVPLPGEGWKSYSFTVPSQSTTLPAGWLTLGLGPTSPPVPDWNVVMANVNQVVFFYGDPTFFFLEEVWDVGLDNASITADVLPVALQSFRID